MKRSPREFSSLRRITTCVALATAMFPVTSPLQPANAATGVIKESRLPTAAAYPTAMVQGPYGDLWFVEAGGNKIGKVSPSGRVMEFAVPTPASRLADITLGPDGNLWFTESAADQIGRITPTGTVTEFPARPSPAAVAPPWKILVLIYRTTDFVFDDASGHHHVIATTSTEQSTAAAAAARRFVRDDIPALDSGNMTPTVTVRFPDRALTELDPVGEGWWPTPSIAAPDLDPTFDAAIVIWNPSGTDLVTGQSMFIGSAAGYAFGRGVGQTYSSLILDAAIAYGHRNVFKHEFGHSILFFFAAAGTSPQPTVTNHATASTYVHCPTGAAYVWEDETDANPIPNSIFNDGSGFTHDYYSGTTATPDQPTRCLGVTPEAWRYGGPRTFDVIPLDERRQPIGITSGPDGNVWFTEVGTNAIGRITPRGVVTEFPIPSASSDPESITSGPDGALWFTEYGSDSIGRMTTKGMVSEFALPGSYAGLADIATGPDGKLWFTEMNADRIGRITVAGSVTEFSLPMISPLGPKSPGGIISGPQGKLWFTESPGIGSISPATGAIEEYGLPTVDASPAGVAVGPDGNIWFTEPQRDLVGRLVLSGSGFIGFRAPVNNTTITTVVAGDVVPLKFRLVRDGAPVLNLDGDDVIVRAHTLSCDLGATQDLARERATVAGLSNKGEGVYQWNWRTPGGYADSCKVLVIRFTGPVNMTVTTTFRFEG
jgi:streptogramin lyase